MDIPAIVRQQKDFFKGQQTKDLKFRKDSLKRLREEITEREKDIIAALHDDFRKPEFESVLSETTVM